MNKYRLAVMMDWRLPPTARKPCFWKRNAGISGAGACRARPSLGTLSYIFVRFQKPSYFKRRTFK